MASIARVEVTLADMAPVAGFIARVVKAEARLRYMTAEETAMLPGPAVAAVVEIQAALRDLGVPVAADREGV